MKKILLASTALVASAGFAAAEVKVGGDGYFGAGYGTYGDMGVFDTTVLDSNGNTEDRDYGFVYDLDIDFTISGESDSGLTFGGKGDLDDMGQGQSQGARGWEAELFVSGDFGTLRMGDISGGTEQVIGDLAGVGLTGLGDGNEFLFLLDATATNGPTARYDYTYEGLLLSFGMNDDEGYAIGVGYDGGIWNVGLGYESIKSGTTVTVVSDDSAFDASNIIVDSNGNPLGAAFTTTDDASQVIGTVGLAIAGFDLKATYGDLDFNEATVDGAKQYGVSAGYGFDAFSVAAFWRRVEVEGAGAVSDSDNDIYGLGVAYDLGGGLALEAGVAQFDYDNATEKLTVADFGISFDF